jgi:hypothetical protein
MMIFFFDFCLFVHTSAQRNVETTKLSAAASQARLAIGVSKYPPNYL